MGTTLTGTTPQDTYDSLIKVTNNGPLSSTARYLSDGLGNDSVLALSTSAVGIGTTTPSTKLQVNGGNLTVSGVSYPSLILDSDASAINFSVYSASSNDYIGISNGTIDLAVFKTSGNVGIGTSAPAQKLAVDGNIILQSSTAATKSLIFTSPNSSWGPQNSRIDFIPADGTNASVDVSINLWNGSVGNTIETLRFPYTGGIKFPATQIFSADANTLDDYEEGTWTPSAAGLTLNYTVTSSVGYYTKIGNVVTVSADISWTSANVGPSAVTYISNLPFTVNANSYYAGSVGYITSTAAVDQFVIRADANSASLFIIQRINGSATTDAPASIWGASNRLIATVTYFV